MPDRWIAEVEKWQRLYFGAVLVAIVLLVVQVATEWPWLDWPRARVVRRGLRLLPRGARATASRRGRELGAAARVGVCRLRGVGAALSCRVAAR
ncbi:MAG: hypothetical protein H6721_00730 [Sandaracinus sp.]|nr:hypothetical protein [Sandaracinus sp.]